MSVVVRVHVTGNVKVPITYEQGDRKYSEVVSGFGQEDGHTHIVKFRGETDAMTLTIGVEEPDNGEAEAASE